MTSLSPYTAWRGQRITQKGRAAKSLTSLITATAEKEKKLKVSLSTDSHQEDRQKEKG